MESTALRRGEVTRLREARFGGRSKVRQARREGPGAFAAQRFHMGRSCSNLNLTRAEIEDLIAHIRSLKPR